MANILKGIPNVWFSADKHLFHKFMIEGKPPVIENGVVIRPAERPVRPMFPTVEDMNEAIITRHNEVVRKGDLVYDLGDTFLRASVADCIAARRRMAGNWYHVFGNHGGEIITKMLGEFVWARHLAYITLKNFPAAAPLVLCHYAMRTWQGSHKGTWHLYGHSHGQLPERPELLSFDVGVDCWNFYPVSIEQVIDKMKTKIPAWQAWKQGLGRERGF